VGVKCGLSFFLGAENYDYRVAHEMGGGAGGRGFWQAGGGKGGLRRRRMAYRGELLKGTDMGKNYAAVGGQKVLRRDPRGSDDNRAKKKRWGVPSLTSGQGGKRKVGVGKKKPKKGAKHVFEGGGGRCGKDGRSRGRKSRPSKKTQKHQNRVGGGEGGGK